MNTAAALIGGTSLQPAQLQDPAGSAALAGGDFTALMAAASAEDPESFLPEEPEAAAALALLAAMLGASQSGEVRPATIELPGTSAGGEPLQDGLVRGSAAAAAVAGSLLAELPARAGVTTPVVAAAAQAESQADAALRNIVATPQQGAVEPARIIDAEAVPAAPAGSAAPIVKPDSPAVAAVSILDAALRRMREGPSRATGELQRPAAPKPVVATSGAALPASVAKLALDMEAVAATAAVSLPPAGAAALPAVATGAATARPANATSRGESAGLFRALADTARQEVQPRSPGIDVAAVIRNAVEGADANLVTDVAPEHNLLPAEDGSAQSPLALNSYAGAREISAAGQAQPSGRSETVQAAVGSPRWASEIGSRITMMAMRGQNEGSLTLTPEHLGPVEVRISVSQDVTNVWFGAQQADTRAALAEALPRLRELFAASGLALGQAGVSQEAPRQETGHAGTLPGETGAGFEAPDAAPVQASQRIRSGLVDAWA